MAHQRTFAILGLAALVSSCAQAQSPKSDWGNLNRLPAGAEIRVFLKDGKSFRGYLQKADADGLSMNATTSQERLSRGDVKRIQVKTQGHRGRNTLLGLGCGMAGGLAAGAAADAGRADDWFPNAGKGILTPVGAVIGTVIGVAMPTGGWKDVYRAP